MGPRRGVADGSLTGPIHVVLVEDRAEEADLLVASIEAGGFDVRLTRVDDLVGLAAVMDASVDVVVVDVDVASVDVLHALNHVRAVDPGTPLIALSGPVGEDVAVDHVKRGVSDWVLKDRRDRLPQAIAEGIRQRSLVGENASAAHALRQSERRLAQAQQVARVGSWEWDVPTNTVVWSKEMYHLYGRDPASFRASYDRFMECVHPADRASVAAAIGSAVASGEAFEFDHRIVRPDSGIRTLYCRGEVEVDAAGQVTRLTGIGQDVTDVRIREQTMADLLRRLGEARALARVGSWEFDLESRRVDWSEELFDFYGVDPGHFEPTIESLCGLLSPDEASELHDRIRRAEETGEGWENDMRMTTPDGQTRVFHGRAQVDCDAAGRPTRIRGTRQDVTELRAHEAQLRDAEERFRLAFAEAPIGVALVAPDGHWLRVNRALCQIVGYSSEAMLQLRFQDLTHPDDLVADLENLRRLLAGEITSHEVEKRYFHSRGHVVWVQLNVSLARDDAGAPLYFITQVQDITGRKVTEERLRESEARFRGLLESAPDAMVIVGADGRIVLVNRQTERMFGFDRAALIGQPVETLIPEQFRARHASHRAGFTVEPQSRPMGVGLELFGVRRDGEEFPIEISLSPLDTNEGLLVSAAIRDITERKQAESIVLSALKRERELTERLRELDGVKSDFVATVSHELRTPLTNIIGAIELLADGDFGRLNAQQGAVVDILDRNSYRLLDLVKDLLDLNQIESGGLGLQLAPSDVGDLIDRVEVQVMPMADQKGVGTEFEMGGDLGMAVIDAPQLERALVNLASNAVKFTPPGGRVTVRAGQVADRVLFVVSDTGIGIPEQEQQHLFTRFFRSSNATENAIPGTGLGLVIVKSIIEGHGGTITVDSTLGVGTTVTVDLPLGLVAEQTENLIHAAG